MAWSKLRKVKPGEITAVFISGCFLLSAEFRIRLLSSEKIIQNLKSGRAATIAFFVRPFRSLRKTRIVSLVEAVDRNLGWKPSCLRRTLALAAILSSLGETPEFKVGVQPEGGRLRAHTWLELDGMRMEMDDEASAYTVLTGSGK